jgi:hypothetical protein
LNRQAPYHKSAAFTTESNQSGQLQSDFKEAGPRGSNVIKVAGKRVKADDQRDYQAWSGERGIAQPPPSVNFGRHIDVPN